MVRYPEGHKQETRDRILDAAAKVFRLQGYAGGGVGDVMGTAGMTKGGFYSHFDSKEALFAEALQTAFTTSHAHMIGMLTELDGPAWVHGMVDLYLSEPHLNAVAQGCPGPALIGEIARLRGEPSAVFQQHGEVLIGEIVDRLPGPNADRRELAIGIITAILGGLSVARALSDDDFRAEGLKATRAAVHRLIDSHLIQHTPS